MPNTFYITTPLYYVNAPPHLGGTYTTIVADTIARYKRMMGFDVKLLSGTDEHGQKIERSAKAEGISPKALADRVYTQYSDLWKLIGIEYDEFIRTTEPRHDVSVIELYTRAKANGRHLQGDLLRLVLRFMRGVCPGNGSVHAGKVPGLWPHDGVVL